jgi:hypothetical protein
MPITLNHSNIGVQYSTGSNYIIETVKSDLYLRNEIYDTIVSNNIQTAPVTPIVSIQDGSNIYAVESYTYTGTANTADYTRVFPKNTVCDILVVGGGGGGGYGNGGGGGAGQLVLIHQATLNGTYTIKVGKGGLGGNSPTKGANSEFGTVIAEGGGANGGILKDGGSGAGGDGYSPDGGTTGAGNKNTTIDTFPGATVYSRGNNGGNNGGYAGGGGGGAGAVGTTGQDISPFGKGGDGLSGISSINYDFKTNFGTNIGKIESGGLVWFAAGGGGGGSFAGNGGLGGGGAGTVNGSGNTPITGVAGLNGTGSGGGGGSGFLGLGGAGGSGIVIIRYLLGTIPTNNLLTEPTVLSPVFTESIRTFIHSGETETQTSHTITVGQNTICDILIVGGGGGGSSGHGGGGGAGQLVLINNAILSGTYTIKVGKGGNGTTLSGTNQTMGTKTEGTKGSNSEFGNAYINVIAEGGGISVDNTLKDGGSGAGGDGHTPDGGVGGKGLKNTTVDIFSSGTVYSRGNDGGDGGGTAAGGHQGGGGGGAGSAGTTGGASNDSAIGHGGDGLSGISQINYDFKTNFGNYGKLESDGNYWFAGGGAGGTYYINSSVVSNGGKGGGGSTPASVAYAKINGGNGLNGTGGGGAGGTAWYGNGGNGGSGIVIIKFKSITNASILDGITHKRLNFAFDRLGFYFDATKYIEYQAQLKTSVGGWRIVRFLPPNTGRWYQGNYITTSTFTIPTIGTPYNYTNEWAVPFGTFDEMFFATFDMTYWLQCLKTSVLGDYTNVARPVIKSSERNYAHTVLWYNRAVTTVNHEDPWISINDHNTSPALMLYGENSTTAHMSLLNAYGGMCVLVRDSATGTTISNPNQYTLNFPVPTIADINNNSNIVLRGAYDISLSTTNSSIIPKSNQYIPKPTTFASDLLSIRYNLLNTVLDPSGAQLTYNTSNTNVYHMGNVGIGTKSPEYSLDVRGSVNAKSYYLNGRQINEPISELGLSEGMIAQVRHLTYTQMDIKNNTGWDAINDNLTTGFVIAITPKSNLSKILVNIIVHIGLAASNYSVWWGIKLYRKIGSGDWTEVTGPNGTETGSAAATAGTPVWISYTMYANDLDYQYKVTNVTGTYLDSPNTTSTVYYTAYWNNRLGDNPSAINTIYLNRAESHGDTYRPAPSSSWTASEIWYG